MAGENKKGLCACGSGLPAARCCAMDVALMQTSAAARHVKPIAEQASKALADGDAETATRLTLEVLELAPGHIDALKLLYQIRRPSQPQTAEVLARRIVALNPNDFWATNELTLLLLGRGATADAEVHARNAVRIAPENAQSHHLMGMIMTEVNRPQVGEYHYRRALELADRRGPILLANLAWNLKNQGKMSEARALYEESMAQDPAILQTVLGFARLEEADRNFDPAGDLLDKAQEIAPGNQSVMLSRAVLQGRRRDYNAALAVLDEIAAERKEAGLGPNELLEKGRLLDRVGHFDEAFEAFVEGKRLVREVSRTSYMEEHAKGLAERLTRFFSSNRLRIMPRANVRTDIAQPLFIIGFPRSGTTLVEQTLTAHPDIAAGDELPFISDISGMMPRMLNSPLAYPEALAELWMGDQREGLDNLRDYYLQRARQSGVIQPGARWFTDKMPLNETHLGLIGLLFPASPIIHVLRHPLDIVLSVFSNQLTHGFYCAYSLESVAKHIALISDLVAHYRAQMPLRYLPIRYEDIVSDQETEVRRMLDFIGEPFDRRCLSFEKNTRYARTASYAQVTEKLYDRSRLRYRAYVKHLAPVVPILQTALDRLGYQVEGLEETLEAAA